MRLAEEVGEKRALLFCRRRFFAVVFFFSISFEQFTCFALADLLISLRALAPRSRASGSKDGAAAAAGVFSQRASEAAPATLATPAASIDETQKAAADDDKDEEEALLASAALARIRLAAASAAVRSILKGGIKENAPFRSLRATLPGKRLSK